MTLLRRVQSWIFPFLKPETPLFIIGLLTAAIIILLIFVIFWSSFKPGLPTLQDLFTSFTLENYIYVFTFPIMPQAALNSVYLAFGTMLVAMFFGVPMAWLLHRTTLPFKEGLITLIFLHSILPGFVRIMGWILLLSPDVGIINQVIRAVIPIFETGPFSPYNIPMMILVQGLTLTPTFFLMLGGAFMATDPSFEESAEASGMSKLQVARRITLPLLYPSILAAAIYVFVSAASMFEIPYMLGQSHLIHFLSTLMYDVLRPGIGLPVMGQAGVYGVILLIPTAVALYYYQKMMALSHRYRTVTGKGYRPKLVNLGSATWIAIAFLALYFIVDMILPLLAVIWSSFLPYIQLPSAKAIASLNLDGYRLGIETLISQGSIGNTIQLMLSVALGSTLIGLILSWIYTRTRIPGRVSIDTIAMLPHVIPGIAIAFAVAFLGILVNKVLPFYGTVLAIVIADTVRRIPFTTRIMNASLVQIHPELEEAVQTSGASKVAALIRVIMPLIVPALLYSFIVSFIFAYREVTTALFLLSPRNMVLSTTIWNLWFGAGKTNQAAAISVMMTAVMGTLIFVLQRVFPTIKRGMAQRGG